MGIVAGKTIKRAKFIQLLDRSNREARAGFRCGCIRLDDRCRSRKGMEEAVFIGFFFYASEASPRLPGRKLVRCWVGDV
jgi:hypothetical protein